ncbi:MAG: hypothetical protein QM817_33230 [Archangium sp.]
MRRVLGLLMMVDTVFAVVFLWSLQRSVVSHPFASPMLLGLGNNPPALLTIGSVAFVSGWFFSRGVRPVLSGLVALISVGVLVEAQAALLEGPMRFLFFSGAVLLGWLAGWIVSGEKEEFANAGALGALAACYLGAVTSKLFTSGLGWVTDSGLRSTIASQHHWGSSRALDALALFVLEHAAVAYALAAFTLLAQASAVLLPFSQRLRRIAVVLLLLFHAGVWLLTPISFPQAMVLLVAAAFVRDPISPAPLARDFKRPLQVLAVGVAVFIGLAWLPPLREYTKFHHARPPMVTLVVQRPPSEAKPPEVTIAGLPVGLTLEGFTVVALGKSNDGTPWVRLTRGAESLTVELVTRGARPFEPPAKSKTFDLFYRQPAPGEVAPDDALRVKLLEAVARGLD